VYNKLPLFFSGVSFPAVPDFYKKNRIARAGEIFLPQKKSGIYFSGRKKYPRSGRRGATSAQK
jgi:hypothetical protein